MSDTHETALVHIGEPTTHWCPHCLKTTLNRSSLYALASTGPRRIGEWAMCDQPGCGYSPYQQRST